MWSALLYSSNYSVYPITRLSGPRSRPNSLRKILRSARESNPGPTARKKKLQNKMFFSKFHFSIAWNYINLYDLVGTALCLAYICLRKTQVNAITWRHWKSLMKKERQHQDTYDKTFFLTIYRISSSCVKLYIWPSRFIAVSYNTNKLMNDITKMETHTESRTDLNSQLHVQYSRENLINHCLSRSPLGA
jgi:hypothetical protein